MKITQDNYEQFFLDHAEGSLSPEMEKELSDFLEANPDLKPVLEDFDPSAIQAVEMRNDKLKARLKKHLLTTGHINEDNVDEWMIRDIEGLLDESEENELREYLSLNPAYGFDYKIFGYIKLSPDLSVTYLRKKELKKKVVHFPTRRLVWLLPTVAAVLLLFIGIRYFSQPRIKAYHPATPPVAAVPLISSPEVAAGTKKSSLTEKKTLTNATTSRFEQSNPGHLNPIIAKDIILNSSETWSLNLDESNLYPTMAFEKKERSLIGKVFNNMITQAREGLASMPKLDKAGKGEFSFWSIAKAGINGFNNMSDRDLELYVRKDEAGKVKSYALVEEERLILSKDVNKN